MRTTFFLYFSLVCLMVCGLITLYSAASLTQHSWVLRQSLRFGLGLLLIVGLKCIPLNRWCQWAYGLYGLSMLCLVGVELLGFVGMGAKRWIHLGIVQIQPSEVMKITLILALARLFHDMQDTASSSSPLGFFMAWLCIGLPAFLILRQPDLGTTLILMGSGAILMLHTSLPLRYFVWGLSILLTLTPVLWCRLHTYQKKRIFAFLDPQNDPTGSGYHLLQSQIALGSGGLWGKGFMQGTQSHRGFVPEKQTDFIFTLWCEEWGFIGALGLISLYLILFITGWRIAWKAQDVFSHLVAVGMVSLLALHTLINISMVTGLCPVVGIPLPFMSYGGTALLTMMVAWGFLEKVHQDNRKISYDT